MWACVAVGHEGALVPVCGSLCRTHDGDMAPVAGLLQGRNGARRGAVMHAPGTGGRPSTTSLGARCADKSSPMTRLPLPRRAWMALALTAGPLALYRSRPWATSGNRSCRRGLPTRAPRSAACRASTTWLPPNGTWPSATAAALSTPRDFTSCHWTGRSSRAPRPAHRLHGAAVCRRCTRRHRRVGHGHPDQRAPTSRSPRRCCWTCRTCATTTQACSRLTTWKA